MSTTSERIKEGMALRNLKQADLVEKTKISKGALSSYVSGRYVPKQNNIYLIAKALDVNEAWLMGADVPMERNANGHTPLESKMLSSFSLLSEKNQKKSIAYTDNLLSAQRMEDEYADIMDKLQYLFQHGIRVNERYLHINDFYIERISSCRPPAY